MLMGGILFPNPIMAGNKISYTVPMHKQPKRQTGHNKDLDEEGLRMPPKPISCFINKTDGVTINGIRDWVESLPKKSISMATLATYTIIGL